MTLPMIRPPVSSATRTAELTPAVAKTEVDAGVIVDRNQVAGTPQCNDFGFVFWDRVANGSGIQTPSRDPSHVEAVDSHGDRQRRVSEFVLGKAMTFSLTRLPTSGLILLLLASAPVFANPPEADDTARIRLAVACGVVLPLPRILNIAQRRVPGEVLKVQLEEMFDRLGYEVKVLTADGRVQEIKLDARTGTILKVEND
jgi:hypothetical protein